MHARSTRLALLAGLVPLCFAAAAEAAGPYFERIATFPVYLNLPEGTDRSTTTSATMVAATPEGGTLLYTDVPRRSLGFVDISNPAEPRAAGVLPLEGTPAAVTVVGRYGLVAVDATEKKGDPKGYIAVVDMTDRSIQDRCDVGGQPSAVAASPDGNFLAVAVENARDETQRGGALPQLPGGHLAIFDLSAKGQPSNCLRARVVDLGGLSEIEPADPEPEDVSINTDNVAALSLQENNAVALVDLAKGKVVGSFDAGAVLLRRIDTDEDHTVAGTGMLADIKREPNGIAWLGTEQIVTANQGGYRGGSRGFTIFTPKGRILFEIGARLEHLAMSTGHYPVAASGERGVEPIDVVATTFGGRRLIIVDSRTGNFAAVYAPSPRGASLDYVQLLPTGVGPAGMLAIPQLGLLVVAAAVDSPADGIRSQLNIYRYGYDRASYPTLVSIPDPDVAAPIGWNSLTGLTADPANDERLYAVEGGANDVARIYSLDTSRAPARIIGFDEVKRQGLSFGYDLQGIANRAGGGFWLAAKGDPEAKDLPHQLDLLVEVGADHAVIGEIPLPKDLVDLASGQGFEGVARTGEGADERVVVVFERPWKDDPEGFAKIGFYAPSTRSWTFALYPLDAGTADDPVGLADIADLGDGRLAVIERDQRSGPDAALKAVNLISLDGVEPKSYGEALPRLEKTAGIDLLPLLRARNGWTPGKPAGLAVGGDGLLYLVTDNEALEKATGETLFLDLGEADDL